MPTPAGFMGPYDSPKDPVENVGTLPAAFLGAVNWLKQGTNTFPPGCSSCGANITIEMHIIETVRTSLACATGLLPLLPPNSLRSVTSQSPWRAVVVVGVLCMACQRMRP